MSRFVLEYPYPWCQPSFTPRLTFRVAGEGTETTCYLADSTGLMCRSMTAWATLLGECLSFFHSREKTPAYRKTPAGANIVRAFVAACEGVDRKRLMHHKCRISLRVSGEENRAGTEGQEKLQGTSVARLGEPTVMGTTRGSNSGKAIGAGITPSLGLALFLHQNPRPIPVPCLPA